MQEERAAQALELPLRPQKRYSIVERFVASFTRCARRRPILVILGATGTGKSELARYILQVLVGAVLGLQEYLGITVEADAALDLEDFDEARHAGVLLDGVGDAELLAKHREVLQGRAKAAKGGKSSTMMYSYPYTLCRRAVIATMDDAALHLKYFEKHHWLAAEDNVLVLRLEEQAWEAP